MVCVGCSVICLIACCLCNYLIVLIGLTLMVGLVCRFVCGLCWAFCLRVRFMLCLLSVQFTLDVLALVVVTWFRFCCGLSLLVIAVLMVVIALMG